MKNLFRMAMVALMATSALVACDKEVSTSAVDAGKDGAVVAMSFSNAPSTRAFGSGATEAWEKTINTASVFAFNATGKLVYRTTLTAAQINGSQTTPVSMVLPGVSAGENCYFALVINRDVAATVNTKAAFTALVDNDLASYNGVFGDVTTKAVRTAGFVMTGDATTAIATEGTTNVNITVKRLVAKIEIKTATTSAFAAKYGAGTIKVVDAVISRANDKSNLIYNATLASSVATTFTQVATTNNNLFYLYEQNAATAGSRVLLKLNCKYDIDGSDVTTGDIQDLSYEIELVGAEGGKIARNGAYLVNANVDGLTGSDVSLKVTVSDWETLTTQNANVGQ